ncbi:MAG: histidine phosphatase family protein [Kiloniellales bacterium]
MKTLYLLRHAKSSWADDALADAERPLNRRGEQAAPRMGAYMHDKGWRPDLVLCSSAVRAQQTWALVAAQLGPELPVKHLKSLYLAAPSRLLDVIHRQPDGVGALLLVGHNPGLERLAGLLAGPGSRKRALAAFHDKFPTAALAVLTFETERWADAGEGGGRLTHFVTPREL